MNETHEDTLFTKIIKREIPATIVYEDEEALAFMDNFPISKGHMLLITKEPYRWMQDVPDELLAKMFIQTKKSMLAMKSGLGCDYVQVIVAGDEVPHFHIHLVPRYHKEKLFPEREAITYAEGEKQTYSDKIKNALSF